MRDPKAPSNRVRVLFAFHFVPDLAFLQRFLTGGNPTAVSRNGRARGWTEEEWLINW